MSSEVPFFDADEVREKTPWIALVEAIGQEFKRGEAPPDRQHFEIGQADGSSVRLLLMPAWGVDGKIGIKLATVADQNSSRDLPTIHGLYVLISEITGIPEAIIDAGALTARRTAAASALASTRLAREDSRTLLIVGTGRLARNLGQAHCAVRALSRIIVWGRDPEKADKLARKLDQLTGTECVPCDDLRTATADADIISTATAAHEALIHGDWLQPGTHLDLVGAYTPAMRETDSIAIQRADRVFVDTLSGAKSEAGDLLQAASDRCFDFENVTGDLFTIAGAKGLLRDSDDDITLYKSVGSALQDLAAARLCMES